MSAVPINDLLDFKVTPVNCLGKSCYAGHCPRAAQYKVEAVAPDGSSREMHRMCPRHAPTEF